LLDIASGGKVVAVFWEKQIELWDITAAKKLKLRLNNSAPTFFGTNFVCRKACHNGHLWHGVTFQ
jgi:hypothetical protein